MISPSYAVRLTDVSKTFAKTGEVIHKVSLSIKQGEFVSFLGASGSGKTTLLRMIAGLERPDGGTIEVSRDEMGFVFQEAHLMPWRTVLENVMLPLELGRTGKMDQKSALDVLKRVGLENSRDKFPNELSGGMKMRVSLARAIVSRPSILLMDEPFAALDEMSRQKMGEDLRVLWKDLAMTIVFVTHSFSEAAFLSDRALILSSNPARIAHDISLDIQEERNHKFRTSQRYFDIINKISSLMEPSL